MLKMSLEQKLDLQRLVLDLMPEDIPPTVAKEWLEHPGWLREKLRYAMIPKGVLRHYGYMENLSVQYPSTVEELREIDTRELMLGFRDFDLLPLVPRPDTEIMVRFLSFGDGVIEPSFEGVMNELDEMGKRPAELPELLAVGNKFVRSIEMNWPALIAGAAEVDICKRSVRALGTSCPYRGGGVIATLLEWNPSGGEHQADGVAVGKWHIRPEIIGEEWHPYENVFAVVDKED